MDEFVDCPDTPEEELTWLICDGLRAGIVSEAEFLDLAARLGLSQGAIDLLIEWARDQKALAGEA